ncbi:MAG: DUF721 domain-containing protein, partial [Pseudomonadota bacterium]
LGEAAARYGFAEPAVLLHWPDIVGEELATLCRPVKVIHGRSRDLSRALLVAAEGVAAPLVEHRAEEIVARVNAHYGYGAISRLKITQTGLTHPPGDVSNPVSNRVSGPATTAPAHHPVGMAEDAPAFAGPRRSVQPFRARPRNTSRPDPAAASDAERAAAPIDDPDLREAISRLGAHVITDPREE